MRIFVEVVEWKGPLPEQTKSGWRVTSSLKKYVGLTYVEAVKLALNENRQCRVVSVDHTPVATDQVNGRLNLYIEYGRVITLSAD